MNKPKILYALQATGNGHVSRAKDIIPALKERADVKVLVSGNSAEITLPFPIDYRYNGMSFTFGKRGGIDFISSFKRMDTRALIKNIRQLPVKDFDIIVSDFEPISAWACKLKGKKCIGLSNQEALKYPNTPRPSHKDWVGELFIRNYAPTTVGYGFHFIPLNEKVFTPIIRNSLRDLQVEEKEHYTIYLPAYDDKRIIKFCSHFFYINWQIFSKHSDKEYQYENAHITPINSEKFIESLRTCKGFLTGGGFQAPAEALFFGKKVLSIPMKNQYEQHYNAAGLEAVGARVIKKLKPKYYDQIEEWLKNDKPVEVNYEPNLHKIVETILSHA